MTLDEWNKLTPAQASRRIGAANQAEQRAAKRMSEEGTITAETDWRRAFAFWENMRVLALSGTRVADPYQLYND